MRIIAVEEHISREGIKKEKLEERLRDMDAAGIDMQVLGFGIEHDEILGIPEATIRAKNINNALSEIVEKYPEKFTAFASIIPQDPEASACELERAVQQLDLKGVMLGPDIRGMFLDMPEFGVLLEMAAKLDVPIYLHPNVPPPDMVSPYSVYPSLLGAMWGFMAEAGLHAMRLICSGVFDKYPNLKIILGHMGEGIPYYLWRIDNQWEVSNQQLPVQAEKGRPGSYCLKKPSEYFKKNFYLSTSGVFWPPVLQFVNSVLGPDRVLFATDYPLESAKEAAQFIVSAPINDRDKEKICHLNAEMLLKL